MVLVVVVVLVLVDGGVPPRARSKPSAFRVATAYQASKHAPVVTWSWTSSGSARGGVGTPGGCAARSAPLPRTTTRGAPAAPGFSCTTSTPSGVRARLR